MNRKINISIILQFSLLICLLGSNQTIKAQQYNELDEVVIYGYISDTYVDAWYEDIANWFNDEQEYEDWYSDFINNNFDDPCSIDPSGCDQNYDDTGTTTDPNMPQFGLDYNKSIQLNVAPITARAKLTSANHLQVASVSLHVANMPTTNLSSLISKYNTTANVGKPPVDTGTIKSENTDKASSGTNTSQSTTDFNNWVRSIMFIQLSADYNSIEIDDCSGYSWCNSDFEEDDDFVGFGQVDPFFNNNPDDPFRLKKYLTPESYYVTGLLAGLGDGIIETADLVYTVGKYGVKSHPAVVAYKLITDFENTIQQGIDLYETIKGLVDLLHDPFKQGQILAQIQQEAGNWFDQVTFDKTLAEAGYQHGKIIFEVLGAFVGIAEVKALLKFGQFSSTAINSLRKLDDLIAAGYKFKKVDGSASLVSTTGEVISPSMGTSISPTTNVKYLFNDVHKSIIDEYKDIIGDLSTQLKGNFGEISTDVKLSEKGYIPLHTRISDIEANGHNGIDGIFEKDGKYYIVESKYSTTTTPSLNSANPNTDLPKQMSDDWIRSDNRIKDAIDNTNLSTTELDNQVQKILSSDFEKVVVTHGPNGDIIYKSITTVGGDTSTASMTSNWIP